MTMNVKSQQGLIVDGALEKHAATTEGERPADPRQSRTDRSPSCPHEGYRDGNLILAREVGQLVAVKTCHDCGAIVEVLYSWDYQLPTLTSPIPPERMAA